MFSIKAPGKIFKQKYENVSVLTLWSEIDKKISTRDIWAANRRNPHKGLLGLIEITLKTSNQITIKH